MALSLVLALAALSSVAIADLVQAPGVTVIRDPYGQGMYGSGYDNGYGGNYGYGNQMYGREARLFGFGEKSNARQTSTAQGGHGSATVADGSAMAAGAGYGGPGGMMLPPGGIMPPDAGGMAGPGMAGPGVMPGGPYGSGGYGGGYGGGGYGGGLGSRFRPNLGSIANARQNSFAQGGDGSTVIADGQAVAQG